MLSNDTIQEAAVHEALRTTVANRNEKSLNYCISYAKAGLLMTGHALHDQILYVLVNMTNWRGDTAEKVRTILKDYIKNSK